VDGPNVYTYVTQNPWTYYDPHGLFEWSWSKFGNSLYNTVNAVGELGQDTVGSLVEIAALGSMGWDANARFNEKVINIGKGGVETVGKGVEAAHMAAGGDWAGGGEAALMILGDTPEEAAANALLIAVTEGGSRYLKGSGGVTDGSARAISEVNEGTVTQSTIRPNAVKGAAAEELVKARLAEQGRTVLGSRVAVNTAKGRRVLDHLVDNNGALTNIEVKSGGATRNKAQVSKDNAMATSGGTPCGQKCS
jgi:hypothetical protein